MKRLDFQIVVEIRNVFDFGFGFFRNNRLNQFARFTRGTDNQTVAHFGKQTFRNSRAVVHKFQLTYRHEFIQVRKPDFVSRQNDDVVGIFLLPIVVADKVTFHAVNNFNRRAFFGELFGGKCGVRESLNNSVVGHRDGLPAPCGGGCD